ncbi:MAG: FtsW/RodA/SpoVE family cell cycle protein, partial [Phycisphaerales bacterium]|nr:FtsW/RodA/SpoVE family cell cycle protein [Phycisphaerales bacterium]
AMINLLSDDNAGEFEINYQPLTAQRIAGAGGLTGMSDAHTRAVVHHNHLPERHNDMIFSVIVARFGLLGGLGLIGLYLMWIVGALMTAAQCREPFGRLMVIGLAAFIAAQMIVNIGMNIGLLPIIGITLPFVSAGGSSMITVWLITGLVLNVGIHRTRGPLRTSFEYDHHG